MPAGSILAFWGVALLLIAVPGADWAFTLSAGLRGRSVAAAVGGLVAGYGAMTVIVAAGVGAVVAQNPGALTGLTVAGGGYLIWHGARTLVAPPALVSPDESGADQPGQAAGTSNWATLGHGVAVSGLNPKGLLIFVALLPQFTRPGRAWPLAVQIGALGVVFMLTCAAFYLALGSAARTVLRARPGAARVASRMSGAGMVVIGAVLVIVRPG
jgi:threonine/homoserine/homoserine lactone efflux protein